MTNRNIDIYKYSWNYRQDEIEKLLKSVKDLIEDAEDCISFFDTEECTPQEAGKIIDQAINTITSIKEIENNTIKEYNDILNLQTDIMDIDTYHDLKSIIKETTVHIMGNIEEYIEPNIELLIQIKHKIEKKIFIKLPDIRLPDYDRIALINPEIFILPEELVI